MSSLPRHSSIAPKSYETVWNNLTNLQTFFKAVDERKDRTKAFQKLDSNDRIKIVGSKSIANKKTIDWDSIGRITLKSRVNALMHAAFNELGEVAKNHTSTQSVAAKHLPHAQGVATKDKHETASTSSSTIAPRIQCLEIFLKAVQHSKDRTKAFQKLDLKDRISIVGSKTTASKKTINWDAIGKKTLEARVQSLMKKGTETQPSTKPVAAQQSPNVERVPTKVKNESSAIPVTVMISRLGCLKNFVTTILFNASFAELRQGKDDKIKRMKNHLKNKERVMSNCKECAKAFQKLDPKDAAMVVQSTKLEPLMAKTKPIDWKAMWKAIGKNKDDALVERRKISANAGVGIFPLIDSIHDSIMAKHSSIIQRIATKDKAKILATSSTTTASRIKRLDEFGNIIDINRKHPAKSKDFAKAFQKLDVRDRTMIVELNKLVNKKSIDWDLIEKSSNEGFGYHVFLISIVEILHKQALKEAAKK